MSTRTIPPDRRAHAAAETVPGRSASRDGAPMPLWRRPGFLVRRLHQIHGAMFAEECASFDITPVQYAVMTTLAHQPDCDQNSLAVEVGLDRTNAADVLRRLARQGLVLRRASGLDRRRVLSRLTPRGTTILEAMQGAMVRAQQRLVAPLAAVEREQFLATMLKLIEANDPTLPPRRANARPTQAQK